MSIINRNRLGMTLIELLAVIAIFSIFFTLLIPNISNAIEKARISGIQTDFRSYDIAIRSFLIENGLDDFEEETLNKYLDKNLKFKNEESEEKNPYKIPYMYTLSGDTLKLYTVTDEREAREFSVTYSYEENEITTHTSGFETKVVGNDYCSSETRMDENYEYKICNGEATIQNYIGTNKNVKIPSHIEAKVVTAIADVSADSTSPRYRKGFMAKNITSVQIPNTIEYIGENAFKDNEIITLKISNKVKTIGGWAFSNNNLSTLVLPNSLTHIGWGAFEENNLTNVILSENLTSIAPYIFFSNDITSLTIPYNLTRIGKGMFYSNKLKSVTIPNSIEIIEDEAFTDNDLESVMLSNNLKTIGRIAFSWNKITHIRIPNSVTELRERAFDNNPTLTTVTNCSNINNIEGIFSTEPLINNNGC